ncbi:DUF192 domain-containing protein [Halorussus marinus]|uniref:DUF192 domain-containing protein n=1 Tax=Halorussus marinus TaxID=2505976 RepID=UPI00106E9639|nr:DUF192 domain-containing protein [Halorussus marinus]
MKLLGGVALGALVVLGGCLGLGIGESFGGEASLPDATTTDGGNVTGTFVTDRGNVTVSLEVAATKPERREGLMNRESLPDRHGMVFVYDGADRRSFWMKNTLVALDIIFVAPDGTVLNVEHATPGPEDEGELDRYRSDGDARYVVELERGFANETGVGHGTEFVFDGPTQTAVEAVEGPQSAR